jgi:hypothetical protein
VFTVATAITRLTSGPTNIFGDGSLTSGQQLQRINEVLEYFYEFGTWRGVQTPIPLTSTNGIITLSASYLRLDGLTIPAYAQGVEIKSMGWAFSANGPKFQDWTQYATCIAMDMGDNSSGLRQYQLTGGTTQLDALSFEGLARKRFTWITDTSTVVTPDSYDGLVQGILAFRARDNQDRDAFNTYIGMALQSLNGNLQEFGPDDRQVQVELTTGMGSFPLVN